MGNGTITDPKGILLSELRQTPGVQIPTRTESVYCAPLDLNTSQALKVLEPGIEAERRKQCNDARLVRERAIIEQIKSYDLATKDFVAKYKACVSESPLDLLGSDFGKWEITKIVTNYYGFGDDDNHPSSILNIRFYNTESNQWETREVNNRTLLVNLAYCYGSKIIGIACLDSAAEDSVLKFLAHIPFNDQGQVCKYSVGEWALLRASLNLEELSALTGLSRAYIKIVASYLGPDDIKSEGAITDTHTAQLGTGNDEVQLRGADAHYGDGMTYGPAAEE